VRLRVGTRRSPLALAQTRQTMDAVVRAATDVSYELVEIVTTGDRITDRPLREAGGKGLFLKELDEALVEGRIDCAVHSLKDVPTELAAGTTIAAVLERADVRDVLLTVAGHDLEGLPEGATIGTTSLRRQAQALACVPHVTTKLLRGNVETRLRRLAEWSCDATFLALAGLRRLGFELDADGVLAWPDGIDHGAVAVRGVTLDAFEFLPAPGQGAVAITTRAGDAASAEAVAGVIHEDTMLAVLAERAFARTFGGGCHLPLAAYAERSGSDLDLVGLLLTADGTREIRDRVHTRLGDGAQERKDRAEELGDSLGREFLEAGADEILSIAEAAAGRA
jgi:hydroxymethylbilane synthase